MGTLIFKVTPCDSEGDALGESYYVEGPESLLGEPFFFKIEIDRLDLNDYLHGKGFKVRFKVHGEKYRSETPAIEVTHDMKFGYSKVVCFESVTRVI